MEIFSESARDISLVVAGWMMPGMTGCELTEKLRHQKRRLAMVATDTALNRPPRIEGANFLNLLIVDDDRAIREACRAVAQTLGFDR
jgi:DNA-binding response OmpR family regulator